MTINSVKISHSIQIQIVSGGNQNSPADSFFVTCFCFWPQVVLHQDSIRACGFSFWRPFRGLLRLEIDDFGVSWEAFSRPFRGLSRFKTYGFEVSWEAFWPAFRRFSRFKSCDFEVSLEAFWRPFRWLSRFKTCDFEVSWEAF